MRWDSKLEQNEDLQHLWPPSKTQGQLEMLLTRILRLHHHHDAPLYQYWVQLLLGVDHQRVWQQI